MVKQQIAFYGSTPAYRPVLELHGWGELQDTLHGMSTTGAWDEMASVIDDEMSAPSQSSGRRRQGVGRAHPPLWRRREETRITLPIPEGADPDRWASLFQTLRAA